MLHLVRCTLEDNNILTMDFQFAHLVMIIFLFEGLGAHLTKTPRLRTTGMDSFLVRNTAGSRKQRQHFLYPTCNGTIAVNKSTTVNCSSHSWDTHYDRSLGKLLATVSVYCYIF
jgi:hypothetical protein